MTDATAPARLGADGTIAWDEVPTLDLATITLGEMAAVEIASGESFDRLITGRASRRLVALYLHELRSFGRPRSWHELSSLRPRVG